MKDCSLDGEGGSSNRISPPRQYSMLPTLRPPTGEPITLALLGNPNAGKTTLFNALTGLRAKTANFPGTTFEQKIGRAQIGNREAVIIDLPGLYSLESGAPEEKLASDVLHGRLKGRRAPDAALVIVDATNLERNLFLASQVLELDLPVVVALNMMDIAVNDGIHIDINQLRSELGCPVVPISARTGKGLEDLRREITRLAETGQAAAPETVARDKPDCGMGCGGCPFQARYEWTEAISGKVSNAAGARRSQRTEKLDEILTQPVIGMVVFVGVMLSLFTLIFWAAKIPMDLINHLFADIGGGISALLPAGDLRSLLVDGVVGGLGGVLVFLPQICILFFALSLLEDTGYMARAALVTDKMMRRLGLPGKAFVPLLSAHACAIPAIMSARIIENWRDRLITILVTPLMSCSARIPVYAMVTALLFPQSPIKAALLFTGAYATGIVFAMAVALVLRRTILPGGSRPLVIELPPYRLPGWRTALLHTFDRAKIFVQQAGTVILVISLVLWTLSHYPKSAVPERAVTMTVQAAQLEQSGQKSHAVDLREAADRLTAQSALQHSFAGRIGHVIEPVIKPLGFDWQIGIGILSSFAAREAVVSTLSIVYGLGESGEDHPNSLYDTLHHAVRSDGTAVFTTATCASLLVFYILAAQCLSTSAVVRRETNSLKWPIFQIVYMTGLAYVAALVVFQIVSRLVH